MGKKKENELGFFGMLIVIIIIFFACYGILCGVNWAMNRVITDGNEPAIEVQGPTEEEKEIEMCNQRINDAIDLISSDGINIGSDIFELESPFKKVFYYPFIQIEQFDKINLDGCLGLNKENISLEKIENQNVKALSIKETHNKNIEDIDNDCMRHYFSLEWDIRLDMITKKSYYCDNEICISKNGDRCDYFEVQE